MFGTNAMAGETRAHNSITLNLATALRRQVERGRCKLYMSDIRLNFNIRNDEYYYYPDIVVTCDKRDTHERFVHYPKVIIEVLSPNTERVDKREKSFAYTSIASLEECVLVSQAAKEATVFRRANNGKDSTVSGAKAASACAGGWICAKKLLLWKASPLRTRNSTLMGPPSFTPNWKAVFGCDKKRCPIERYGPSNCRIAN